MELREEGTRGSGTTTGSLTEPCTGVCDCTGRELPITGSKQVLEEQLVGMTKILTSQSGGGLGFQRTPCSNATGDPHWARTGQRRALSNTFKTCSLLASHYSEAT